MLVLGGNDVTELFTECKDCLEKSVGGKYGRSREGASALFIQLCNSVAEKKCWVDSKMSGQEVDKHDGRPFLL